MPPRLPLVFTRSTARDAGYSIGQINRLITSGRWIRLRRGAYAERARLHSDTLDDVARLRLQEVARIAAAILVTGTDTFVSGRSGHLLHRMPESQRPVDDITLVAARRRTHGCGGDGILITPAQVPAGHSMRVQRIPVLTPARLAVDALRCLPLAEALMVGDGALRVGANPEALASVLHDCAGWPGIVQARTRTGLLDGRRESPLESASVALFVERDLPIPDSQVEIWHDGRLLGRADFGWLDKRVLGEADGRTKYVDDLVGSPPPEERVWSERVRQGWFADAGWETVRWIDRERRHQPALVEHRIRAAFERAERLGLTERR